MTKPTKNNLCCIITSFFIPPIVAPSNATPNSSPTSLSLQYLSIVRADHCAGREGGEVVSCTRGKGFLEQ